MKTVLVRFNRSGPQYGVPKDYEYYIPDDLVLVEGDSVVVDSPIDGYTVTKVVSTKLQGKASKSIVCKVDDVAYKARIEADKERAAIFKELEKISKQVEESTKYQYLAKMSPAAAELLRKLESL